LSTQKLSESFGFFSASNTEDEAQWQCEFVSQVNDETVRGSVLNITSFIDELIIKLLVSYFPNKKKAEQIFLNLDSPMATLVSRANIAHALALLRDDEITAIKIIAKIRNEFAHKWESNAFERHEVIKQINKIPSRYLAGFDGTGRAKFNFTSSQIIQELLERHKYAARISKHVPKAYRDIFDLTLEERQAVLAAERWRAKNR
jgi:hypothetical protein